MSHILFRASIEGAVLAAIVWAVIRIASGLSPAARTILWWCVAAKFVVGLVWTTPIPVPILPAESLSIREAPVTMSASKSIAADGARATGDGRGTTAARGRATSLLLVLWVAGLTTAAVFLVARWKRMTDVVAGSAAPAPATEALAVDVAARVELRRPPRVRMSQEIATPLVTGVFRHVVLLPAGSFDALSEREQRMALCHELAHIKRADLWFGCVPALAERLFFFHPLAHLAAREYAIWREASADAHVIAVLNEAPQAYAQLLLRLGVSDFRPSLGAAAASWSFSNLKRRIAMLDGPSSRANTSRTLACLLIAAAVVAIVPLRIAARNDAPRAGTRTSPGVDTGGTIGDARTRPFHSVKAPDVAAADRQRQEKRRLNFVLVYDDHNTTMSGSVGDVERARRHRRPGERMLWFRHEGREYVVRDPGILDQVVELWAPVNALGDKQGQLGAEQGELGTRQGELGAKQGELGAQQGILGARQGALGMLQSIMAEREGRLRTDAERRAFEEQRREIEREMRELDDQMRALDAKMRELDEPMRNLGADMEVLGKQMEVLGKKMEEETRKAEEGMHDLLARALTSGLAQWIK